MNIFICYRRKDTRHITARLVYKLEDIPDVEEVFIDVDDIFPGEDFAAKIDAALAASDVCLVMIGEHWAGAPVGASDKNVQPRIFNDKDFVRREIAAALASDKTEVIPVLADGASMPEAEQLPKDIQRLAKLKATYIRHASFDTDVNLIEAALFSRRANGLLSSNLSQRPALALFASALAGLFCSAIVLVVLGVIHQQLTSGRSLEETLGSEGFVWFLIGTLLATGTALSIWLSRRR
jgi:hypothetical protein